uniref:Cupin-like domain-containing protein n=1 Tax=viral metagenome TaxID=1070528 RepID=A0A6C0HY04_9ZZZZ
MLITIVIFIVLFFLYIHINAHYAKNEDLEIYETDYTNNKDLQDVCNLKQPTLFEFSELCPELFENENYTLDKLCKKYDKYFVKVKDSTDYFTDPPTEIVDSVPLSLGNYRILAMTDSKKRYYTEGNDFFIEDAALSVSNVDEYLKPNFSVKTAYDIIAGSAGTCMPMQYHNHYRRFLIVTSGMVHVKMTPWKSNKYLHSLKDYDNYEFRSAMNVWSPDSNKSEKIRADYDRIKFTEFDVHKGYVLYIPPYWWYSLQFAENMDTVVLSATYDSAISMIANCTDLFKHFLQIQNNKEIITRTLVAEPKPVVEEKEVISNDELEGQGQGQGQPQINPLEELVYPSGEPHTGNAYELAEQLQSQPVVPIRDQHEQLFQHVLG